MKRLELICLLALLLLFSSLGFQDSLNNRLEYLALHYWDDVEFSDKSMYYVPENVLSGAGKSDSGEAFSQMEIKAGEFFSILLAIPDSIAVQAINNLMNKALQASAILQKASSEVASSGVASSGVALSEVVSSEVASSEVASSGVASSGVASSEVALSGVALSGVTSSGVASSGVALSGVASSGVASSGVASSGVALSGVASSGVASSGVALLGVASSGVASSSGISPVASSAGISPDISPDVSFEDVSGEALLEPYGFFMALAEKYFYSVESPYYNERLLLHFFDHKIKRTDIAEIEKSREKYLAGFLRRNSVGSKAENFMFADYDVVRDLHYYLERCKDDREVIPELKMHMLVFISGDCRECKDGVERLGNSPVVKRLRDSLVMTVSLVCVEGFYRDLRSEFKKKYSHLGIVSTDRSGIVEKGIYSIRHSPSVYILDLDGVVLLKDASVSSAIQFLLEQ